MNQTNIVTRGSLAAMFIAVRMYVACCAVETPFGSPGFVS